MKAILEFDFDKEDSDDRSNLEDALNGIKWKVSAWKFDQWLRAKIKYSPDGMSEDYYKILEETRDELHDCLNAAGLKFE
jgi:hypothetical protein